MAPLRSKQLIQRWKIKEETNWQGYQQQMKKNIGRIRTSKKKNTESTTEKYEELTTVIKETAKQTIGQYIGKATDPVKRDTNVRRAAQIRKEEKK